jgi:hypothetical protein
VGHQIAEVYLLHQIDILQEKLDYAITHNAENRLKLEKAKSGNCRASFESETHRTGQES